MTPYAKLPLLEDYTHSQSMPNIKIDLIHHRREKGDRISGSRIASVNSQVTPSIYVSKRLSLQVQVTDYPNDGLLVGWLRCLVGRLAGWLVGWAVLLALATAIRNYDVKAI